MQRHGNLSEGDGISMNLRMMKSWFRGIESVTQGLTPPHTALDCMHVGTETFNAGGKGELREQGQVETQCRFLMTAVS